MILYGRDLSPFVRRIAVWCAMQGRAVERRQIMVAGEDFARVKELNPVGRVPILELDDGTRLIESYAIGEWLDETSPNGVRLLPAGGVARRDALQRLAVASGTAEKAVALVYERNRRPCGSALEGLAGPASRSDAGRAGGARRHARRRRDGRASDGRPDAGDVAAVIAWQFVEATNPWVLEPGYPRLAALVERAMQLPEVAATKPAPV